MAAFASSSSSSRTTPYVYLDLETTGCANGAAVTSPFHRIVQLSAVVGRPGPAALEFDAVDEEELGTLVAAGSSGRRSTDLCRPQAQVSHAAHARGVPALHIWAGLGGHGAEQAGQQRVSGFECADAP